MSSVVPNRVRFGARTPPVDADRAVELLERALSTRVEGVVAGFSDQVDPGAAGPGPADPHMLYAAYDDGPGSVSVRFVTDFERVGEFVGVLDRVLADGGRLVDAHLSARFELDGSVAPGDVAAPAGWTADVHELDRGSGVELVAEEFTLDGAAGLTDRLDAARGAMEGLAPDVVPAGDSPTDPVEEYYRVEYGDRIEADTEDAFLRALYHDDGYWGWAENFDVRRPGVTLLDIDVAVVERGLDERALLSLDDRVGEFSGFVRTLDRERAAELATRDPTLVEADVHFRTDDGERHRRTETRLVATEGDRWRILR